MPAHTAPLSIGVYNRSESCTSVKGAFPCEMIGDMFITFHATEWLLNPTFFGNRVCQLPINSTTGLPTGKYVPVIYEENLESGNCGGDCFRPVDTVFDKNGHMFVTSDTAFEVYRVTYGSPPPQISLNTFEQAVN
jgi:glucose/arabinose dehydrogenase